MENMIILRLRLVALQQLAAWNLLLGLPLLAAAAELPRATVSGGVLEGALDAASGVRSFKGIPYAQPPLGELRWQAPQPAVSWKGVRPARRFGPRAMQRPVFSDMVFRSSGISEDCLYLNVWTPAHGAGKTLPVLVYFYGGGFTAGDGSEPRYDGASMARQGMVAVTVNYRLNVFGFLAHPELTAESPHHASGNYGLMDQAAALRWVQANIAAFGGDPARVTIAGESAGSYSVSAQMISPLAQGTFARAIGESGALTSLMPPDTLAQAEQAGQRFAALAGAADLKVLRAMPASQLLEATARPDAPGFDAIVDGWVIADHPARLFASGRQARVPLLAGWNSLESGPASLLGDLPATAENLAKVVHQHITDEALARRLLEAYAVPDSDPVRMATEMAGDVFIGYSTWQWIDLHARSSGQPVYRYLYVQPRPASVRGDIPAARGATHSAEIEYALGNLPLNPVYAWTADDRSASRLMQQYFVNFIRTGNPNGQGLPQWPVVGQGEAAQVMQLGAQAKLAPRRDRARYEALGQAVSRPAGTSAAGAD
jgi:para-nitrobenzyl esterase